MSKVFVVDTNKHPLDPVHPGCARLLLTSGKAAVWRRYPFTLILKKAAEEPQVQPLRIKLDPGSRTTGIAIVNDVSGEVVFAAELSHRGHEVKAALESRRAVRRSRRRRHTRYRKARFDNRKRRGGWLAPSLESRISNTLTWVKRLGTFCLLTALSMELVKFDPQAMDNPEISGAEYQQGTLYGYEVREYLLEKWKRKCAYCAKSGVPLQVEHIQARANGGTNRISNLCLSCEKCNVAKGARDIKDFLKKKPEVLKRLLAQAKAPLKDAAACNATRWALLERLKECGLPVERGSGGLTKFNRITRKLLKAHWIDAACVGKSTPEHLQVRGVVPLRITANGHGCRQVRLVDKFGFPRGKPKQAKIVKGFQTGDIVKAKVSKGVNTGVHVGRVAIRAKGSFDITTETGKKVQGINHRACITLHQCDGYSYRQGNSPCRKAGTLASSPCPKDRGNRKGRI